MLPLPICSSMLSTFTLEPIGYYSVTLNSLLIIPEFLPYLSLVLSLTLSLQIVVLFVCFLHGLWLLLLKARYDVLGKRKWGRWAFSGRFYVYLGVRLCLAVVSKAKISSSILVFFQSVSFGFPWKLLLNWFWDLQSCSCKLLDSIEKQNQWEIHIYILVFTTCCL